MKRTSALFLLVSALALGVLVVGVATAQEPPAGGGAAGEPAAAASQPPPPQQSPPPPQQAAPPQTQPQQAPPQQVQDAVAERATEAAGELDENAQTLEKVGSVLLVFLVLSMVFETALTPLFNWRFFLARFEGKGLKTPITVILAFITFWGYDLDIIRDLLDAMGYTSMNQGMGGQALSALLIAGGSDGILRIYNKLGIRDPTERKKRAEEAQAALRAAKAQQTNTSP